MESGVLGVQVDRVDEFVVDVDVDDSGGGAGAGVPADAGSVEGQCGGSAVVGGVGHRAVGIMGAGGSVPVSAEHHGRVVFLEHTHTDRRGRVGRDRG